MLKMCSSTGSFYHQTSMSPRSFPYVDKRYHITALISADMMVGWFWALLSTFMLKGISHEPSTLHIHQLISVSGGVSYAANDVFIVVIGELISAAESLCNPPNPSPFRYPTYPHSFPPRKVLQLGNSQKGPINGIQSKSLPRHPMDTQSANFG